MRVKEFIDWIEENNMEEGEIYVHSGGLYEKVRSLWESERDGGAVVIETESSEKRRGSGGD